MKTSIFNHITLSVMASLYLVVSVTAYAAPKPKFPDWKQAKPMQGEKLKAGDHIFLLLRRSGEGFNGIYTIAGDGTILPKFCKDRIKISGLTEAQATASVLKHLDTQQVFDSRFVKISVVNAARFPKLQPKK